MLFPEVLLHKSVYWVLGGSLCFASACSSAVTGNISLSFA